MKKLFLFLAIMITLVSCTNTQENNTATGDASVSSVNKQSGEDTDKQDQKLQITTSIIPFASITNYIGGEYVEAKSIIPSGVSPHGYDLKPNQMVDIENADLIVNLGLDHIDGFLEKAINGKNIVVVSKGIDLIEGSEDHEHEHHEDEHHEDDHEDEHHEDEEESIEHICEENGGKFIKEYNECEGISKEICEKSNGEFDECGSACRNNPDAEECIMMCVAFCKFDKHGEVDEHHEDEHHEDDPHIWTSSENALIIAKSIESKLSELQPQNTEYFKENYKNFESELQIVKQDFLNSVKDKNQKEFIVFHDAYNYLFQELAIDSSKKLVFRTNVLSDPNSAEMKKIIDEITIHGVNNIYKEPQFSNSNLDKLASDYNLEVDVLNPLGIDSGKNGYIDNYKNNLKALEKIYE